VAVATITSVLIPTLRYSQVGSSHAQTVASEPKEIIPNDKYFKNELSYYHPGGKITVDTKSYEPSPKEFVIAPGVTLDITHAWAISTGSKSVVVALLDDGFFYDHEDLKDNIWHNPGETGRDANGYPKESNGKDDDGNGYVDDVIITPPSCIYLGPMTIFHRPGSSLS